MMYKQFIANSCTFIRLIPTLHLSRKNTKNFLQIQKIKYDGRGFIGKKPTIPVYFLVMERVRFTSGSQSYARFS